MNENEDSLISQCLNGERTPDCDYCPAQPQKGGGCCFGLRHEYNDSDCLACHLEDECRPLTHGYARSDPRVSTPRIIYPGRRPANTQGSPRIRVNTGAQRPSRPLHEAGPLPGEPLLAQQPVEPEPIVLNPKDNLFTRFLKVGAWGAGEGFFEMGLNFFRKRRPE